MENLEVPPFTRSAFGKLDTLYLKIEKERRRGGRKDASGDSSTKVSIIKLLRLLRGILPLLFFLVDNFCMVTCLYTFNMLFFFL